MAAVAPSPVADTTCWIELVRISPAAKMQGISAPLFFVGYNVAGCVQGYDPFEVGCVGLEADGYKDSG